MALRTVDPVRSPVSVPEYPPRPRRRRGLALLALLTAVVGVLVPLAPIERDTPNIAWPKAGQLPSDTLVPLVPYRPASLTVNVPCSSLRALEPRGGEALRTHDLRGAAASPGLVVREASGRVRIVSGNEVLADEPVPAGNCAYRVVAGAGGITATRDGIVLGRSLQPPPQVEKLQTDLAASPAGRGLSVEIRPDARFNSAPSALKSALLVLEVLLLVALLLAAVRRWPGRRLLAARLPRIRPHPADFLVVGITAAWLFVGPTNLDDGWYLEMALSGHQTGYIGNTVGQYSVAENPFVLSQYLMQAWASHGWSFLWMRLLIGLMAIATYLLLRRTLHVMLGRVADRRPLRRAVWLLALAQLLWWLPLGLTLRPEPVIVLGSAAVLLLAETARARRSVGLLAIGVAAAAVTTTASPSGLVAWAPLVVQLPWLWRWLRGADTRQRMTAALVLVAASTAAVPIAFADASLGSALATHATQRSFYPDLRWYDEILQISGMFEPTDVASWGHRLPVFLTLACAALVAVAGRGSRPGRAVGPVGSALTRTAATIGLSAAALSLSPTKWVSHYPAIAAFGTIALALTMLRFPLYARGWSTAARLTGGAFLVAALAASFAGPNLWRPLTDWGQPFGQHPSTRADRELIRQYAPHLGPLYGSSIVLWVVLGLVVFALLRRRLPQRIAANATGTVLLRIGSVVGVLLMLVVMVVAPLRQHPAWSLASSNLHALTGHDCGLADSVRVDLDGTGRFIPARSALAGQPVLVDIKVRPVWPCLTSTTVSDGMVQLPRYRVVAGEGYEGDTDRIYRSELRGGVDAIFNREARIVPLAAHQTRIGPNQTSFGNIERIDYTLPADGFDLRMTTRRTAGWTVGPPIVPLEDDPKPKQ